MEWFFIWLDINQKVLQYQIIYYSLFLVLSFNLIEVAMIKFIIILFRDQ